MAPAGREKTWDHGDRGSAHAAHAGQETSQSTGLYNPSFEHDACGVAFIADLTGRPGHDVVSKALTALCNLEHRGAQGGDPGTGDGAGILTQIPDAFFREVCDFDLPPAGSYAAGLAFLPTPVAVQEEGAR
jgi:glutamate synthase (NADPH/NADH) large chain